MIVGENGQVSGSVAPLSAEAERARRLRSVAIGLALAAMVGVFYVLTIVRLSGGHG